MPNFLSPVGNNSQMDISGRPLSGGMIYTYLAGTDTPAQTFVDSPGSASQTNPIVLNAFGFPANPIWLPSGSAYKFSIFSATGVLQRTIDNITGINDAVYTPDQFVVFSGTPTYVSGTQFSVAGDQVSVFSVGRRVRFLNPGGYGYGTIINSTYSNPNTTVTITPDSTPLAAGLQQVSFGLLSQSSGGVPGGVFGRQILASTTQAEAQKTLGVGIVDTAYFENPGYNNLTPKIPLDNTIPQSNEGTQVCSATITPKSITNRFRATFRASVASSNAGADTVVAALFRNSETDAFETALATISSDGAIVDLVLQVEWVPGTLATQVIRINLGCGTGNVIIGGNRFSPLMGGRTRCTLTLDEITK